jgi:hypothetical protein
VSIWWTCRDAGTACNMGALDVLANSAALAAGEAAKDWADKLDRGNPGSIGFGFDVDVLPQAEEVRRGRALAHLGPLEENRQHRFRVDVRRTWQVRDVRGRP